jgi:hypothetical protein
MSEENNLQNHNDLKLVEPIITPMTTVETFETIEIIETPLDSVPQPDWKEKIKNQLNHYSSIVAHKSSQLADDLIFRNYYLNLPYYIVEQSNNKNTIPIEFSKDKRCSLSYRDRKLAVFGLTFSSVVYHFMRANSNFKLRWTIPYYVFYSLLLCRENLDPFL